MSIYSFLDRILLLPFQLAIDINTQFSPKSNHLQSILFKPFCHIDSACDWINLEALGNTTALRAQECAKCIGHDLQNKNIQTFKLHLFLGEYDLTLDNLYFIIFLSDYVEEIEIHIQSHHPLNSSIIAKTAALQEKKNIKIIKNEQLISEPLQLKQMLIQQQFTMISLLNFPFKKNDSVVGYDYKENIQNSIGYAWTLLKTGGYPIATLLLETLLNEEKDNPEIYEQLLMHLQLIRFHSHQYVEMTEQPYPEFLHLDENTIRYLHYIKAYAGTLSRNLLVAKDNFLAAGVHINQPIHQEFDLYQLNIFALYHVLSKDIETAYALEIKIENAVNVLNVESIGLRYVNFINLARLYKHLGKYEISLQYYEKAYDEIAEGGFTTSDYLYYNMNLGSLYESMGNPLKALTHWFKAALHWITAKNPYALAWRPKIILAQENTQALNIPLSLGKTSQFFIEKLSQLSKECHLTLSTHKIYDFSFNQKDQISADIGYLSSELMLYGTNEKKETSLFKEIHPLRNLLSQLLNHFIPVDTSINHLILDSLTENQLRKKVDPSILKVIHHCKKWQLDENISHSQDKEITIHFKKSKLITSYESLNNEIVLKYKRSFMNQTLSIESEKSLFENLLKQASLTENVLRDSSSFLPKDIINLLYKNVIDISDISMNPAIQQNAMLETT